MADASPIPAARSREIRTRRVPSARKALGRAIMWGALLLLLLVTAAQALDTAGVITFGFRNWRPVIYGYAIWSVAICVGQVMTRGEKGYRALFVLPAALFTLAVAIFPTFPPYTSPCSTGTERSGRTAFHRRRQLRADVPRPVLLECHVQHGVLPDSHSCRIRDRLWPGAASECGNQRPQVLPCEFPSALHAQPCRSELDYR